MGKTRKPKKHAAADVNPTGLQSLRDAGFDEELFGSEAHPEGPICAIVEQLQSACVEDKMCALQALSFLCQNQQRTQEIQDSDIAKIIASWLMDANKSIRQATAGALRNLSVCGVDVCETLVERDVLTPLLALFAEYAADADWTPTFDKSLANQLDERSDTFLQAIHLLSNLCESTALALDPFNQTRIVSSFVRCLNTHTFGNDIALGVAQCLLVISEDNATAWRLLDGYRTELSGLLKPLPLEKRNDAALTFLATLAAGIIANVPALADGQTGAVFAVLATALEYDTRARLNSVSSELPVTKLSKREREMFVLETAPQAADDMMEEESESDAQANLRRRRDDLPSTVETTIKEIGWMLSAQRVAGEIITNMCTTDDDENGSEWEDDSDSGEMVHDYEVDANGAQNGGLQNTDRLPVEVLEAIKSLGLVEKLWQRAQPLPENVLDILAISDVTLPKKCNTLRISSLLCLQNLCNLMSIDDLGGPAAIYAVWLDLGQQVFQGGQQPDQLEASTALMRATLDHLRPNGDLFAQMTAADLQLMLDGVQLCGEPEIRANWLRMLGVLGVLLPEQLGKLCMVCVVETSVHDDDAWTISEAADALMDMFSDNDWLQAVHELALVRKTQEMLGQLKARLRQQRRELGDRYAAVCTVRTNLTRFVKYMEAEQSKYQPTATTKTNGN